MYRAKKPLPDGYRDVFDVQLLLPEGAAGQTLRFPVIQTCEQGETAWIQTATEGQDPEELEAPAPAISVTAATGEDHHGTPRPAPDRSTDAADPSEASTREVAQVASTPAGEPWVGITGLVAGLAGLAAGATALARANRRG